AVGQAMNKNPHAPEVPCHRVVASGGGLGGFASGSSNKIAILKKEGVQVKDDRIVDFKKKMYRFRPIGVEMTILKKEFGSLKLKKQTQRAMDDIDEGYD
ncbi:MAG: MGMT family protein, partial [Nanoarchaeota archaeon]